MDGLYLAGDFVCRSICLPLYLNLLFGFVLFGFVAAQFMLRYIFGKKIKC